MRRGWCPSLHEPMAAADGLLARVKPPGGRLSAAALRRLADAAVRFGSGTLELTQRGNVQVRGLTPASAPVFAARMVAAGLASADPATERRRNVIAAPLGDCDPTAAADAPALAAAIEAMLAATPALTQLPPKFGFAVDAGGVLPLCTPADITLRTDGARHWIGIGQAEAEADPAHTVALLRALALGAGADRIPDAAAALADVGLRPLPRAPSITALAPVGDLGPAVVLGVPFGQADAALLASLAALAETQGDGVLRLTPWRSVALAGVTAPRRLCDAAAAAGLIVDLADPRRRIAACIGSAGCANGHARTRDDAATLATATWTGAAWPGAAWTDAAWPGAAWPGVLHVSGCPKGCAHPRAALTLVAGPNGYGLVRHGRADAPPDARGLSLPQAMQALAP